MNSSKSLFSSGQLFYAEKDTTDWRSWYVFEEEPITKRMLYYSMRGSSPTVKGGTLMFLGYQKEERGTWSFETNLYAKFLWEEQVIFYKINRENEMWSRMNTDARIKFYTNGDVFLLNTLKPL